MTTMNKNAEFRTGGPRESFFVCNFLIYLRPDHIFLIFRAKKNFPIFQSKTDTFLNKSDLNQVSGFNGKINEI